MIEDVKIIFVVAPSGCGKSFTGDYLSLLHDFHHVDGDFPIKHCHVVKYQQMVYNMFKDGVLNTIRKQEDGPTELWQPYLDEIVQLTLDAATAATTTSDTIVLTFASYRQTYRNYVVTKLVKGGVLRKNITVLQLTINLDVKLEGLYHRSKRQIEESGMTIGDVMRLHGWEGEGEISCAEYIECKKKIDPIAGNDDIFQDLPQGYGKMVDVSGRDMTHLDGVDEALGIVGKRNKNKSLTFDEIREKVQALDVQRDKEWIAKGGQEIIDNYLKEIMEDGTDDGGGNDTEEQSRRRSSLASIEYEMQRASLGSTNDDNTNKSRNARRTSLIKTGKI